MRKMLVTLSILMSCGVNVLMAQSEIERREGAAKELQKVLDQTQGTSASLAENPQQSTGNPPVYPPQLNTENPSADIEPLPLFERPSGGGQALTSEGG